MIRKLVAVFALVLFLSVSLAQQPAAAITVFSDNFSAENLAAWSQSKLSPSATQTVTNGVARFIVPTPHGGNCTYSFVVRDGFTSTVNSTIVAAQDIYVTKVPQGCPQGNGAIFFLYVCDSTDLGGNQGNFGVGIDGSGVWSLWIGGMTVYTYVFQTSGALPASNTWYRVGLSIDNSAKTVTLTVNGAVVISASQQQFTDKPHPISLMSGMGENWWSDGSGPLEIDVDNVELFISDGSPLPPSTPAAPAPTLPPNQPYAQSTTFATPKPTASPSPKPLPTPNPTSTTLQATTQNGQNIKLTIKGNITDPEMSNLTVVTDPAASQTIVKFSLSWSSSTLNSGNVTIPKGVVQQGTSPAVYLDRQLASSQGFSEDSDNYYVWCLMPFSHEVAVVFSDANSISQEPPLWAIVLVAVAISVAAVVKLKKR